VRENKLFRKLQVTGGSTIIVSLPKDWVKNVGVKAGSYVTLIPQPDGSLLITPREDEEEKIKEAVIYAEPTMEPQTVVRQFIACYIVGYDLIRVRFKLGTSEHKTLVKKTLREKMIGVEPIKETSDELLVQCLVGYREIPLDTALNRMNAITMSMIDDAVTALKDLNRDMALEVSSRDDEVDRLYFFMVRQLKRAVRERTILNDLGISNPRACLGYRIIIKSVERSADHASRIASLTTQMYGAPTPEVFEEIKRMKEVSLESLRKSTNLLFKFDLNQANQIINKVEEVRVMEQKAIKKIFSQKLNLDVANLRLITESLRRIVEYGADIAEIVINLSIEEP